MPGIPAFPLRGAEELIVALYVSIIVCDIRHRFKDESDDQCDDEKPQNLARPYADAVQPAKRLSARPIRLNQQADRNDADYCPGQEPQGERESQSRTGRPLGTHSKA